MPSSALGAARISLAPAQGTNLSPASPKRQHQPLAAHRPHQVGSQHPHIGPNARFPTRTQRLCPQGRRPPGEPGAHPHRPGSSCPASAERAGASVRAQGSCPQNGSRVPAGDQDPAGRQGGTLLRGSQRGQGAVGSSWGRCSCPFPRSAPPWCATASQPPRMFLRTFQVQALIDIPATQESPPLLPSCHQISHGPSTSALIRNQRETPPSMNFARAYPPCTHRPPSRQGFLLDPGPASMHQGISGPDPAAGPRSSSSCIPACASAAPRTIWCTGRRRFNSPVPRHPAPETAPALALAQTDRHTDKHTLADFLPDGSHRSTEPCSKRCCACRADTTAERAPTASTNRLQPPRPPSPAAAKQAKHHPCPRAAPCTGAARYRSSRAPSAVMKQWLESVS